MLRLLLRLLPRLPPLPWLAAFLCAAIASGQEPAKPPAKGAGAPAKQGPAKPGQGAPGKQGGGKQGGGKQAPGKQAPGKGAPGKQGPGNGAPTKGAPGKRAPGKAGPGGAGKAGAGARAGQRAKAAATRPALPESTPPQLTSVSGSGDPIALALADDGTQVYSIEGTSLVMLDAKQPTLPELARVQLDATVLALQAAGKKLYIAGGTSGVGVLDLEAPPAAKPAVEGQPAPPRPPPQVQWLDQAPGRPCTCVAVTDKLLLATFASERESELRVYMRGGKQAIGSVKLPGRALDIAVRDSFAYLALGQFGVVRADLHFVKQPKLERGPDLTLVPVPEHFKLKRAFAREVAIGGSRLYVAADVTGLVDIDLEKPWGTTESFVARPLTYLGRPAYAVRVDARGDQVAVGTARMPALIGDAAPYGLLGGIPWDLATASIPTGQWQPGSSEALWVFQHVDGGQLELSAIEPIEDSSWRSLALRGRRIYEQHAKLGVVVRELALQPRVAQAGEAKVPLQGSVTSVGKRKPRGLACLDGKPSLQDPRLFFFGVDTYGSDGKGFLRMVQGDQLKPVPELATQAPIGTSVGAQWPDALTSREWFMSNGARGWRIQRFTHRPKIGVDSWELVPPAPLDATTGGGRGRSVFHSTCDGDLVLATHDGTRFGLVGYSIKQLSRVLAETKPGGRVMAKPLWQLPTHFDGEKAASSTWRTKVFVLEDGRRIAAIAAGSNTDPASEHFEKPQLVLYDVTNGATTPPKQLAVAWGDEKQSLAVAVDVCQIRRRSCAAVATTGGQLLIFDVNDPTKPRLVRSFKAPVSGYDGERESLFDVEIATDQASGRVFAYLAATRAGLIRVELSATGDDLSPDVLLDTPGWAAGVTSTVIGNERYWLVGDQRAGLRLYR
ncbi:MAG: hypothetical protein HZA52_00325 [Planctomycetes bacterium]|nr:hypothetical protein [Planctomycetota bacterium]